MRLSQLARKLEISPTELILFYKENRIEKYKSHNNKIEERDLKLAIDYFSTEDQEADIKAQVNQSNKSRLDIPPKKKKEEKTSVGSVSTKSENDKTYQEPAVEEQEIEVISMPKIKLEGVKVVGKIDLPEPIKKVKDENNSVVEEEKRLSDKIIDDGSRKEYQKNRKKSFRHKGRKKNIPKELSYEEKLKREERKRIREQQRAKELKKAKKKLHYIKNVKSNISPTQKKRKSRKTEQSVTEPINTMPVYKNPVRKFWAWLNGEYD
jgi:hypothetical protein